MATLIFCDRCNTPFGKSDVRYKLNIRVSNPPRSVNDPINRRQVNMDLCGKCAEELVRFAKHPSNYIY